MKVETWLDVWAVVVVRERLGDVDRCGEDEEHAVSVIPPTTESVDKGVGDALAERQPADVNVRRAMVTEN